MLTCYRIRSSYWNSKSRINKNFITIMSINGIFKHLFNVLIYVHFTNLVTDQLSQRIYVR